MSWHAPKSLSSTQRLALVERIGKLDGVISLSVSESTPR